MFTVEVKLPLAPLIILLLSFNSFYVHKRDETNYDLMEYSHNKYGYLGKKEIKEIFMKNFQDFKADRKI